MSPRGFGSKLSANLNNANSSAIANLVRRNSLRPPGHHSSGSDKKLVLESNESRETKPFADSPQIKGKDFKAFNNLRGVLMSGDANSSKGSN